MTSEQEKARALAERIARRVNGGEAAPRPVAENGGDLGAQLSEMRSSLDDLRQKLVQLESRLTKGKEHGEGAGARFASSRQFGTGSHASSGAPALSGIYVPATGHPSLERFGIEEASISELVDFFEGEKRCELEPGGKPCDHCAMCSTRGF